MRFVAGDPSQTAVATWYRAKPGAAVFPGAHAFGSAIWDTEHPTSTLLGDQDGAPKSWYNGRRINRSDGQKVAGPISYFTSGAPAPDFLPRASDGFTPVECLSPPFGLATGGNSVPTVLALGGVRTGGVSSVPIAPGVPCANCPSLTPLRVTVNLNGFLGLNAVFNGTHVLTQVAPCSWDLVISPGFFIFLVSNGGPTWSLDVNGTGVAIYTGGAPDCITPVTIPLTASTMAAGPTAIVTPGP